MFTLISEAGFIPGGKEGGRIDCALYCGFYGAARVVRSHYRDPQRGVEKGAHCSTCFFGRVHSHRWSVEIVW